MTKELNRLCEIEWEISHDVDWFNKASKQDDPITQYIIGLCYKNGKGLEKNMESAVEWYTKAAEQGYVKAQYTLGFYYYMGKGKNLNYSFKWFNEAANNGDKSSQFYLAGFYERGEIVVKNLYTAFKFYKKAALQDDKGGQYKLGEFYELGKGINKNLWYAFEWYKKALHNGHSYANAAMNNIILPEPPSHLCCPITGELMNDPVITKDGHTYERIAIEKWMSINETSPITREKIDMIIPNRIIKKVINEWKESLSEKPDIPQKRARHE